MDGALRRKVFQRFVDAVAERLEQASVIYGDRSFSRDPAKLLREIEEELLDVCGWSFILWCRIRRLRERMKRGTDRQRGEGFEN